MTQTLAEIFINKKTLQLYTLYKPYELKQAIPTRNHRLMGKT